MAFSTGFQLSLELTNAFGVLNQAVSATRSLIDYSRQLRNSGSDIVVEEDLADVFGRMRIDHGIETAFKQRVMADLSITPLYGKCPIELHAAPGPTVDRAFRDHDRKYLSTVVQLSMLAWMHDRTQLASAISDCLNKRAEMGLPGASPSPGVDGIWKTLEACSSQTTGFAWNTYQQEVRYKLWRHFPRAQFPGLYYQDSIESATSDVLLSAMDCLCLVQSLPEARKMVVQTQRGMIPLVVWAYYVLGLNVQIVFSGSTHQFGIGTPQVIIQPGSSTELDSRTMSVADEVLLLDESTQVLLSYTSNDSPTSQITSCERHPLRGHGTEHLRRYFNRDSPTEDHASVYSETAQIIVAAVIVKSRTLRRGLRSGHNTLSCTSELERWRIMDTATIVFEGIQLDNIGIDSHIHQWSCKTTPEHLNLKDIEIPTAIAEFLQKSERTISLGHGRATDIHDAQKKSLYCQIANIAAIILLFAHVIEVRDCSTLPLLFVTSHLKRPLFEHFNGAWSPSCFVLEEGTLFGQAASCLIGPAFQPDQYRNCFLVSDFGWSVHVSACDDGDPAAVRPELIHIRRGVPTNAKTRERKMRIVDLQVNSSSRWDWKVLDRGSEYTPRCAMPVLTRTEYFGSRSSEFFLSIRFDIDVFSEGSTQERSIFRSYRALHRSLWDTPLTNQYIRCDHPRRMLDRARLGPDAVTCVGYSVYPEPAGIEDFHSRLRLGSQVYIYLTASDHRARWLTIQNSKIAQEDRVMLRSYDCCENCALDALSGRNKPWNLIL